jgi:hypothetical protein
VKNFEPVVEMVGMAATVERKVLRQRPMVARENSMLVSIKVRLSGR